MIFFKLELQIKELQEENKKLKEKVEELEEELEEQLQTPEDKLAASIYELLLKKKTKTRTLKV